MKEQAVLMNLVMNMVGKLPKQIGRHLWRWLSSGPSVSVSNMAGPTQKVTWHQHEVKKMGFFVPPEGRMGVFICFMTYDDKIILCTSGREDVVDAGDLQVLCEALNEFLCRDSKERTNRADWRPFADKY